MSLAETASGFCCDEPPVKPPDWPDVPDEDEYQTLPDEVPEEVPEYACHETVTACSVCHRATPTLQLPPPRCDDSELAP